MVYTIYTENEGIKDDAVEKEWYFERLKRLISSSLWDGDACNDFYYKFIKWIGHDLEADYHSQMYNLFQPLHALYKLDVGYDSIPTDMLNDFNTAIEYAKTVTDAKVYTEYEVSSLRELLYLELMSMIQSGIMIRKCKNCGKYFVVNNRKIAYCDRTNKFNGRCSAVGPMQSFQKKMKDDEPLKMYNRAYKAHHARYRNGTMSKEELSSWCSKGKEKLKEVRTGKLDISSFQKWLKE